ncbi:MAG TPA: CpsB/CapC family capsule biosynthesis tyrosine phosphatase [Solirubrobacteraceae bacterium]|nr:CpsB/CapC family capsule biosynthesis tyrosine phosphatase [Solirubrobacteraceae bacterium]
MIDLHCHVLAGIDDGPETVAGSLALARAAVAAGVSTLVATPHASSRYPNGAETIGGLVAELRERLAAEGVPLRLEGGAEVALTHVAEIEPSELSRLRLGGGEWLLVEPPFTPVATALEAILQEVRGRGHRILLAHPERCPAFHRDPQMLGSLVRSGILTSITAGSLVGRFGAVPRRFALQLVREEMVHNVASDAHDLAGRPPGMRAELEQAGLGPLTEWLTEAVPAAILGGGGIPARPPFGRPAAGRPRRWRLRR